MIKKRLLAPGVTLLLLLILGVAVTSEWWQVRYRQQPPAQTQIDLRTTVNYPASYDFQEKDPAASFEIPGLDLARKDLWSAPDSSPLLSFYPVEPEIEQNKRLARLKEIISVDFGAEESNLSQEVRATRYTLGVGLRLTKSSLVGIEAQKEFHDTQDAEFASSVPETDEAMRVKYQIRF